MKYHLSNWSVFDLDYKNTYLAPEQRTLCLKGFREEDQRKVRTSTIVNAVGNEVTTESGSVYILGEPRLEYLAWMKEHGFELDPINPVKIRKRS